MGDKALLVIDGQPRTMAVGASAAGVRLLALEPGAARVEVAGSVYTVRQGAAPIALAGAPAPASGSEVVIPAGAGGHFISQGAINGRSVRFMVDTGATLVAIGASDVRRLGIDLSRAERGMAQTAGGAVPVQRVTLASLRLGDVELRDVPAVVVPTEMPHVLLGNSALARFQMRRDNDVMRLELRR